MFRNFVLALALLVVTLLTFSRITGHDFINYDDQAYISENSVVQGGWTLEGVKWAFTNTHQGHWHPLTWLSHMTDCQLFGLDSGRHHRTSLLIHCVNVLLLYFLLIRMTGAAYRSAFVAAIFAIHPLNVETVASLASRKDLLAGLCWLTATIAYSSFVRKRSLVRYLAVLCLFLLGLAAKAVLVVLPLTLLLLDFWPLGRIRFPLARKAGSAKAAPPGREAPAAGRTIAALVLEKVALLLPLLAAIPAAVYFMLARYDQAMTLAELLPGRYQVGNALTAYCLYLKKIFLPLPLVFPSPYRLVVDDWQVYASLALLVSVTVAACRLRRDLPYLLVGWLWFMLTLMPMIGLLKIGPQTLADRYLYIPLMGMAIFVIWGVAGLARSTRARGAMALAGLTVLLSLMFVSRAQTSLWRDSETLFRHAISVTPDNPMAHFALGFTLEKKGNSTDAIASYEKALTHSPGFFQVHNNLANLLVLQGKHLEAVRHYEEVIRGNPQSAEGHANLANTLAIAGRRDEALRHYGEALWLQPANADTHMNLGVLLMEMNRLDEAVEHYEQAMALRPDMEKASYNLGLVRFQQGRVVEAVRAFENALRINPGFFEAQFNLGIIQARRGELDRAVQHLEAALRLRPDFSEARRQLVLIHEHLGEQERARRLRDPAWRPGK